MKNFEKRRTTVILCLILMLSIVAACGMLASTYAKYTSQIDKTAPAEVAKWNFDEENKNVSFAIQLGQTVDANTLTAGKIAPGTSGSFNIPLKNGTTETGVDFTIALNTITGKPTYLKFYKDAEHLNELVPGTGTITGQLAAGDSNGLSPTIYWQWPYETAGGDTQDTADGKAAAELTVGITITGVQTEPGTANTSQIK